MGFYLSPLVDVVETDLTTIVPAVSTNITVYCGQFQQGPVNSREIITSKRDFVDLFGKPDSNTASDFWSVYNFLEYGNKIYVTRVVNEDGIQTSLSGSHADNATTINVSSTTDFPQSGRLRISASEVISYNGKTSSSFENVTRGIAGTTAAAYTGGETAILAAENSSLTAANNSAPFTVGTAATGTITVPTPAVSADEDYVTLNDGTNSLVLAVDKTARINTTFTTDFATDDNLDVAADIWTSGDIANVASSGTLPTGLTASTNYYVYRVSATEITLHTNKADSLTGASPVDVNTSDGSGTHTITKGVGEGTAISGAIPVDITADTASATASHLGDPLNVMVDDLYTITLVDATNFEVCPFSSSSGYLGTLATIADANTNFAGSAMASTGDAGTGIVRYKSGNTVYVQLISGSFSAGDSVDNVNSFSAADTQIVSVSKTLAMTSSWSTPTLSLTNSNSGDGAADGNQTITITEAGAVWASSGMSGGINPDYVREDYVTRYNKDVDPVATPTFVDNELLKVYAKSPGVWGQDVSVSIANPNDFPTAYAIGDATAGGTTFLSAVDVKPLEANREIALVVIITDPLGNRQIIEKYVVSLKEGILDDNGNSTFAEDVINNNSAYIFVDVNPTTSNEDDLETRLNGSLNNSATTITVLDTTGFPDSGRIKIDSEYITYTGTTATTFTGCTRGVDGTTAASHDDASVVDEFNTVYTFTNESLTGGADGISNRASIRDEILLGYDLYNDSEDIDINIIMDGGNANDVTVQQYIVDSLAELRKDCLAVLNVPWSSVNFTSKSSQINGMVDYRESSGTFNGVGLNRNTSYACLYGNWKYQYDKFTDKFRWIPLSGDVAGSMAYTDQVADPWWANAGFARGRIKNVSRFKVKPNLGDRDIMYKNQINPIVEFSGDGPVIWGQKTLLTRPSAFDRINVRRLFLTIEKAISTTAKYFLFEFNDRFTRSQLKSVIEPYLRDVQGRRGLTEFLVICDESNNTAEVIQRNELVCDIYIKPNYVAEFIKLNFIATRLDTNFQELISAT